MAHVLLYAISKLREDNLCLLTVEVYFKEKYEGKNIYLFVINNSTSNKTSKERILFFFPP